MSFRDNDSMRALVWEKSKGQKIFAFKIHEIYKMFPSKCHEKK